MKRNTRKVAWGVLAAVAVLAGVAHYGHMQVPAHTWDWTVLAGIVAGLVLLPATGRKAK